MGKKEPKAAVRARIEREFIESSGAMVADSPLKATEKAIIENLVIKGHNYFAELGWSSDQEIAFLSRPNVRRELDRQNSLMSDGPGLIERQKFLARMKLASMVPMAMKVVALTLRGTMKDSEENSTPIEQLPTREQYVAAMDILDRCGIVADDVNVNLLIAPPVERKATDRAVGHYDPIAVVQRDRVRVAVDSIIKIFGDSDSQLDEIETARSRMKKRKKLRKKNQRLFENDGDE